MRVIALQSGSKGNCIYLEADNVRVLFDAGISGKRAQERLAYFHIDIRSIDALLISHDHIDHVSCAGVFNRKFGIPLWITQKTFKAASSRIGEVKQVNYFTSGETIHFDGLNIETIKTPHDAVDGVCFVADDGKKRFGVCTDLGCVFNELPSVVQSVNGLLLESNYDPIMLRYGDYPPELQDRIRSSHGHLSNEEAAELLLHYGQNLETVMLGHISENNNTERQVVSTHKKILGKNFRAELAHYRTNSNCVYI